MKRRLMFLGLSVVLCAAQTASADPYRLKASAYVDASASPAGYIMLDAQARQTSLLDAQAVVWTGVTERDPARALERTGDVMVMNVRVRDPEGRGEVRFGRMLLATGAVRPVQIDGAVLKGRAPWGTTLEVFGGMPVVPELQAREFDWVIGQRLSQSFGEGGVVGFSYWHRRDGGALAGEELGADATVPLTSWFDASALGAYDMLTYGLAEARVSAAFRVRPVRIELFGVRRSPSRLLPATSLFSALGDIASDQGGAAVTWRAAPRLDVVTSAVARASTGQSTSVSDLKAPSTSVGFDQQLRVTLRFDDRGDGAVVLELRRVGIPDASWLGGRVALRLPLAPRWTSGFEAELVRPDDPRGRGALWPWGLLSLRFAPNARWEAAAAIEASSSPSNVGALTGLARVATTWGGP
jgi:hypothetical protein